MPVVSSPLLCFGLDIRLIVLHQLAQPVFHHLRDNCALRQSKKLKVHNDSSVSKWLVTTVQVESLPSSMWTFQSCSIGFFFVCLFSKLSPKFLMAVNKQYFQLWELRSKRGSAWPLAAALQKSSGRREGNASYSDLQPGGGGNERKASIN